MPRQPTAIGVIRHVAHVSNEVRAEAATSSREVTERRVGADRGPHRERRIVDEEEPEARLAVEPAVRAFEPAAPHPRADDRRVPPSGPGGPEREQDVRSALDPVTGQRLPEATEWIRVVLERGRSEPVVDRAAYPASSNSPSAASRRCAPAPSAGDRRRGPRRRTALRRPDRAIERGPDRSSRRPRPGSVRARTPPVPRPRDERSRRPRGPARSASRRNSAP